jgi:heme exporter protein A
MSAALSLDQVGCVRGGRALFRGLSLQLHPGQLLRVKGANGAGKTSLLRLLCGLLPPTEGEVRWRGQPLSGQREAFGQSLVYLGHAAALKDELSPLENLQMACQLVGRPAPRSAALQALAQAGLRGFEGRPVRALSQGQRRRSALARLALAPDAALWVLDEPFNALDGAAVQWLEQLLEGQLARGGMVALTSHQGDPLPQAREQVVQL